MEEVQRKLAEYRSRRIAAKPEFNGGSDVTTGDSSSCLHLVGERIVGHHHQNDAFAEVDAVDSPILHQRLPLWLQRMGLYVAQHSSVLLYMKLCLYVVLQTAFVMIDFGGPFFVVALIYGVWSSMRSGSRSSDEPSAYSVFNPNCERLLGQLTAEQFEGEIRRDDKMTPPGAMFDSAETFRAIWESLLMMYGDRGGGAAKFSISVKVFNEKTRIFVVRIARECYEMLASSILFVNRIGKHPATLKTVHVGGSIRSCQKRLVKYHRQHLVASLPSATPIVRKTILEHLSRKDVEIISSASFAEIPR